MYTPVDVVVRDLTVSPAELAAIEEAAAHGLRYPAIAWAAGMEPEEFRAAFARDARVPHAVERGRSMGEYEMSKVIITAAKAGDSKSALSILQHRFGWQTKGEEVDTALKEQQITKQDLKKNLTLAELETLTNVLTKAHAQAPPPASPTAPTNTAAVRRSADEPE